MSRATPGGRRGLGALLFVVLMFMAVVLPVLIARHLQGSQARTAVAHAGATIAVLNAARSALAEAWWELERSAARPADPLFAALHFPGQAAARTIAVPRLARLLRADPELEAVEVADGQVAIEIGKVAATSRVSSDLSAEVTLHATARHRPTGLARTLSETRSLRVSLVGLPPPLDQFSVVVLDASNLVPAQANGWIDESASALTEMAAAARELAAAPDGATLGAALASIEPPPPLDTGAPGTLHHFPARLALVSFARGVGELAALDLTPRLAAARRRVLDANAAARQTSGDDATFVARVLELAAAHRALLEAVRRYQSDWVEYSDEAADWLWGFATNLERGQWAARAQYHFEGADAAQQLTDLLDRLAAERPARALNGVVYLDNPGAPLRLAGRAVRGRLAILATGRVELEDVRLADRTSDRLIVQAEGALTVSGRVEAALVAHGALTIAPQSVVVGALVLPSVADPTGLAGRLDAEPERFDCALEGTENPAFFQVALAPWALARGLEVAR